MPGYVTMVIDAVITTTTGWAISAMISGFISERTGGLTAATIGLTTAMICGLTAMVIHPW